LETEQAERINRRKFLRAAAVTAGAVAAVSVPGPALAQQPDKTHVIYRLSARGRSCLACHGTSEHKWFKTPGHANRLRAHPGCRCEVFAVTVSEATYRQYFKKPSANSFDDRTGGP